MSGEHPPAVPLRRRNGLARALLWLASLIGLLLLVAAVWTLFLARSAERRYPRLGSLVRVRPELGETTAPSMALHFLEAGAGPPVVLLHGAFGGSQDWSATVMRTLAARYRVIAFDRPGHGYSERVPGLVNDPRVQAEAVRAALRELRVERPILVGFSWGGTVALAYAVDHEGELGALVTVNAASHGKDEPTGLIYRIPAIPIVGPLFEHTFVLPLGRVIARSGVVRTFAPEPVPDSFADSPLDLALTPGRFKANAEDSVILDACAREQSKRYDQLTLPMWIVVGEGDLIVNPRRHGHRLHEQVRGSHLVSIEGAGHQLLYRHAKEIVEAIDAASESPAHER